MEEINRNIGMDGNSDIDIDQSVKDTDVIEGLNWVYLLKQTELLIEGQSKMTLMKITKRYSLKQLKKKKEKNPSNLEAVHLRNVDRKKMKEKIQTVTHVCILACYLRVSE